VYLGVDGPRVVATNDDVVDLVLAVADGSLDDVAGLAADLARGGATPLGCPTRVMLPARPAGRHRSGVRITAVDGAGTRCDPGAVPPL
jgi:hypothetical protein